MQSRHFPLARNCILTQRLCHIFCTCPQLFATVFYNSGTNILGAVLFCIQQLFCQYTIHILAFISFFFFLLYNTISSYSACMRHRDLLNEDDWHEQRLAQPLPSLPFSSKMHLSFSFLVANRVHAEVSCGLLKQPIAAFSFNPYSYLQGLRTSFEPTKHILCNPIILSRFVSLKGRGEEEEKEE